jgi:hypothetical protein
MKRLSGVIWICLIVAVASCSPGGEQSVQADSSSWFAKPAPITLPEGTPIKVALQDGIGTDTSSPGAEFTATLVEPIVLDRKTALKKGATVRGRIVDLKKPGRVKGRASLSLVLTSVAHNGENIALQTRTHTSVAKSTKGRDAAIIGGAAGVGAAIGAIAGGGKGAATGAAVGGAGGTGAVLATPGANLHYPPETVLRFVLSKSVTI